ncbi:MAG: nitrogen regulation protein NR(I) [Alcaligenaceae bacterium]|nr:nitrogen regulation protein NR(I) [Alcaligenaceae bacterium]
MKPVWIVDDDQSIRWVLEKALSRVQISTKSFECADDMLEALSHETPAVLVTDVRMPGKDGLTLLQEIKAAHPNMPVIVMTAYTDLNSTVAAFKKGAFDYLPKPFDINDAVSLVQRAIPAEPEPESSAPLVPPIAPLKPRLGDGPDSPAPVMMKSSSVAMQEVFRAIGRLAVSPATVLITGESGTGKELIARALHQHSPRASGPFVALNAAAIPRDLLEAELFGHEKGAFTGATQQRRGRFEEAHGGTLFLDEIGDMPFELQTRLLRVLAEGSFYRVGGSQAISVDVRIVAATHQPLEQRVAQGQFREDLFHRLNVIRLRLPPLRERKEDIPALAELFLQNSARSLGVARRRLTPAALEALKAFDYPGNIRQLENFCHWLTVMSSGQLVDVKDLPPEISAANTRRLEAMTGSAQAVQSSVSGTATSAATMSAGADQSLLAQWKDLLARTAQEKLDRNEPAIMATLTREFESCLITTALRHSRDRKAEAAQRLGIGRNTLTRKCQELGIRAGD